MLQTFFEISFIKKLRKYNHSAIKYKTESLLLAETEVGYQRLREASVQGSSSNTFRFWNTSLHLRLQIIHPVNLHPSEPCILIAVYQSEKYINRQQKIILLLLLLLFLCFRHLITVIQRYLNGLKDRNKTNIWWLLHIILWLLNL